MTPRDRFNAWMHFQPVDHPPLWEWGPWGETHKAWLEQGMGPEGPTQFADCDPRADCGVSFHMEPWFEVQVIEEDDQYILYRNHEGILMRERKPAELSMPHFLDYPVKNRADFERLGFNNWQNCLEALCIPPISAEEQLFGSGCAPNIIA